MMNLMTSMLTTMMTKEVRFKCGLRSSSGGICGREVQHCKHGLEQHAKTHMMSLYELYQDHLTRNGTTEDAAGRDEHPPSPRTLLASGSDSIDLPADADDTDPLGRRMSDDRLVKYFNQFIL